MIIKKKTENEKSKKGRKETYLVKIYQSHAI